MTAAETTVRKIPFAAVEMKRQEMTGLLPTEWNQESTAHRLLLEELSLRNKYISIIIAKLE